jgi:hypothetical protein
LPDLRAQIAEVESEVDSYRPQMASAREAWLDAAGEFLSAWWLEAARKAVQGAPDVVSGQLGAAGVKALRGEVENLASRARGLIAQRTFEEEPTRWPDQVPTPALSDRGRSTYEFYSHDYSGRWDVPAFIEDPFTRTVGLVAAVLVQHGLPLPAEFEETWERKGGQSEKVLQVKGSWFGWPKEVADAINVYGDLVTSMFGGLDRLRRLNREQKETEAADLWDQAG